MLMLLIWLSLPGEVIRSSKDVKVAFLRQEFVDELVPERSLMDEFLSAFKEEQEVLDKLSQLEKDLEGATNDPEVRRARCP